MNKTDKIFHNTVFLYEPLLPLANLAQWLQFPPVDQRVSGFDSRSRALYLSCRFTPRPLL